MKFLERFKFVLIFYILFTMSDCEAGDEYSPFDFIPYALVDLFTSLSPVRIRIGENGKLIFP
jgi:hypothetical protein